MRHLPSVEFTEEEIRKQLEALGYRHIPIGLIHEFKQDLDEIVKEDLAKSNSRSVENKTSAAAVRAAPETVLPKPVSNAHAEELQSHASKCDGDLEPHALKKSALAVLPKTSAQFTVSSKLALNIGKKQPLDAAVEPSKESTTLATNPKANNDGHLLRKTFVVSKKANWLPKASDFSESKQVNDVTTDFLKLNVNSVRSTGVSRADGNSKLPMNSGAAKKVGNGATISGCSSKQSENNSGKPVRHTSASTSSTGSVHNKQRHSMASDVKSAQSLAKASQTKLKSADNQKENQPLSLIANRRLSCTTCSDKSPPQSARSLGKESSVSTARTRSISSRNSVIYTDVGSKGRPGSAFEKHDPVRRFASYRSAWSAAQSNHAGLFGDGAHRRLRWTVRMMMKRVREDAATRERTAQLQRAASRHRVGDSYRLQPKTVAAKAVEPDDLSERRLRWTVRNALARYQLPVQRKNEISNGMARQIMDDDFELDDVDGWSDALSSSRSNSERFEESTVNPDASANPAEDSEGNFSGRLIENIFQPYLESKQ